MFQTTVPKPSTKPSWNVIEDNSDLLLHLCKNKPINTGYTQGLATNKAYWNKPIEHIIYAFIFKKAVGETKPPFEKPSSISRYWMALTSFVVFRVYSGEGRQRERERERGKEKSKGRERERERERDAGYNSVQYTDRFLFIRKCKEKRI